MKPEWPVYAVSPLEWKGATDAGFPDLLEPAAGASEWQLWRYSSALLRGTATVDPLSLTLTLQDHADERMEVSATLRLLWTVLERTFLYWRMLTSRMHARGRFILDQHLMPLRFSVQDLESGMKPTTIGNLSSDEVKKSTG